MKKFFKYFGLILGGLIVAVVLIWNIFYYIYSDWGNFVEAAEKNDILQMQEILNQGFDINQSFMRVSPLLAAISYTKSDYNTIKFMLNHGADVNFKSKNGLMPIHHAIMEGRADIVKLLLEYGTDASYKINNKTLLDIARITDNSEIIKTIEQYQ